MTNILSFQETADLTGDPARPGFIVVAPEGRATMHFYPTPDDQGPGSDNWYRQLERRGRDADRGADRHRPIRTAGLATRPSGMDRRSWNATPSARRAA